MPLFHTRRCHSYTCFFHVPSIPTLPNNRRQPHSTICPPHITIRLTNMQCKLVVLCPVIHAYSCGDSQPASSTYDSHFVVIIPCKQPPPPPQAQPTSATNNNRHRELFLTASDCAIRYAKACTVQSLPTNQPGRHSSRASKLTTTD